MPDAAGRRYLVRLLPSAQRDLDGFDRPVVDRLAPFLQKLTQYPRLYGSVKLSADEGYRVRVGDYRILYRIDDYAHEVFVYRIKHRREAYR